jgi:hypothetical protein
MILLGLSTGLALLRRSIGAFTIVMVTAAAYKEPAISVPSYLGACIRLGA